MAPKSKCETQKSKEQNVNTGFRRVSRSRFAVYFNRFLGKLGMTMGKLGMTMGKLGMTKSTSE